MLKIYNSLTKDRSNFKPLDPAGKKVSIYVCGNTVYDYCHIGHARSMIVFDVVVRYLRNQGYEVKYVRNITDIDDKIIKRAQENNEAIETLTQRFIDAQHEDERALGLLPPDYEPRATEYIPKMLELINRLVENGYAYIAKEGDEQGDVLFNVRKFAEYGKLSGNSIERLLSTQVGHKADPLDFALWKISKPGEPRWPSPWGDGRPGWHIECSAMSTALLGQPFDIHGGGMDLKFPHHENEIAQSEAASGQTFAKTWMHVGLLQVNGMKMSKSLGNFLTIRDALAQYHPEELRFFMMNSHYSNTADFSERNMYEAKIRLFRFYHGLSELPNLHDEINSYYWENFLSVMDDDFNTSVALACLGDCIGEGLLLKKENPDESTKNANTAKKIGRVLGILQDSNYLQGDKSEEEKIESLIDKRNIYRTQKKWADADAVRKELLNMGIVIEDTANGTTTWRRNIK